MAAAQPIPEALPAQVVAYDALGREVARPFDGLAEAGEIDAVERTL